MKLFKYSAAIFLIFINISTFCQITPKQFIGTWTTKRSDDRSYSVTEETWVFLSATKGRWIRKLIMSDGAVICNIDNPFTWKLTSSKKLLIALGMTTCKCSAAKKKFADGLDKFIESYKSEYNNEHFPYNIKSIDSKTINIDDFTLTKQ